MQPFNVTIPAVPDLELGPLLTKLTADGYDPIVAPVAEAPARERERVSMETPPNPTPAGLPAEWRLDTTGDEPQSYRWPDPAGSEAYHRYRVFAADMNGRSIHIALGDADRTKVWGKDRPYTIAFLTSGAPQTPLVEFLAADDYDETREMVSVVRGLAGTKKMFGPGDVLPTVYAERFELATYRDRVRAPKAWNKLAVVTHEDDYTTMLNHALLQATRRGDI